jgi:predicted AAA+ superfamily ATPase
MDVHMDAIYYALNPWWEGKEIETGISRDAYLEKIPTYLTRKQIEVFIGSRRTGKTTLLKQFIKTLLQTAVSEKDIFYLALDHPVLSGITLSEHVRNMRKRFMHDRDRKLYLFLDEVQESPQWEAELKALYDLEPLKIFCTGSTSSLIARQAGKLTGRQIVSTVFPLSFHEFIRFRGEPPSLSEDYKYEQMAHDYLSIGGYPEQVLNPSSEYMANLLDDILARDLARLHPIKKSYILKDLLRLIGASTGSRTSFNKLSKILGLSVDTVKEYIGYLEMAFLVKPLEKWTTSYSERVYSQKKIYLWDNGVKTLLTGGGDEGNRAENAVFLELQRNNIPCGYYAESDREVDFVIGPVTDPVPIEVKYMATFDWKDKRFDGVRLFLNRFPSVKNILLITKSVELTTSVNNVAVHVVPLWKFLWSPQKNPVTAAFLSSFPS